MNSTKSNKTARITKALNEMRSVAREEVAKREVLHFRIDKPSILEIYEVATRKKEPVGSMVREWVLERLQDEQGTKRKTNLKNIEQRLSALEKRIGKNVTNRH